MESAGPLLLNRGRILSWTWMARQGDTSPLISKNTCTLCFPGAKVLELLEIMPTIKKHIPALKTVVLHIGSNYIMRLKYVKLRGNFLQLLENAKKLAGHIIVSGSIPSPRRCGTECFSRLCLVHLWEKFPKGTTFICTNNSTQV
uniref:Uncharacterized protein n=1 Tax=Salmo trutta TaxID=8032 RepID=A0A674EUB2_SALTR